MILRNLITFISLMAIFSLWSVEDGPTTIVIDSDPSPKSDFVKKAFNDENVEVIFCSTASTVRSPPISEEETRKRAIARAKNCLEKSPADLAIGFESGILFMEEHPYLCHWGAIVDRREQIYVTCAPLIRLPDSFAEPLQERTTLETLLYEQIDPATPGFKGGAISIFTSNKVTREKILTQVVQVLIGQYNYYVVYRP